MGDQDNGIRVDADSRIDTAWQVLGLLAASGLLIIFAAFLCAPHKIERYYLISDVNNGMATCVIAEVNWAPDMKCYCSNNPQQAIQDVTTLNEGLK